MTKKWLKKGMALGLVAAMAATGFAGCGSKKSAGGADDFTWWIYKSDGDGTWYETYEEDPSVQFINQQYWNSEDGGIGTKDNGTQLNFSFQVPVTGAESDNFNTMISTGEYPEIVDTVVSTDSAEALNNSGIAMDITEYVEKYMPNYLAYLDANPELKPLVTVADKDGKSHYYAIYSFTDGLEDPWEGSCYRRDWIVKYATPTDYVWDWDSDAVKTNGHPEVTPLAEAKKANNMNGWKKNDVTSFTADYGQDPDEDYTDNVVFPSGKSDPYTISDWEWMFEAFEKAIDDRGWSNDTSAYCTTVSYSGYSGTGDLVSSFGGGNGNFYVNDDTVSYDGASANFQNYVEAMQNWYNQGWLDSEFNTRSSDMFFMINSTGVNQGKVGLWCGLTSTLGTAIRTSCADATDAKDAYVMGAALPVNDTYGTADQMYKDPDSLYQSARKGTATIVTEKAKDKDLATLFTYFDWTYTMEGALVQRLGLSEEQYKSVKLDPDLYADNNLTAAYTTSKDDQGRNVYSRTFDGSSTLTAAICAQRMDIGLKLVTTDDVVIDSGNKKVVTDAYEQFNKYLNTGGTMDYQKLFSADESATYGEINTAVTDYVNQNLPQVVKGTMSWADYKKGLDAIDTNSAVEIFQKYVSQAATAKNAK